MTDYGFYITNLILRGENKKDAKLSLQEGLNVISGASDTGKTYIFECINYMFGSQDRPKEIEESKGYANIIIELKTYRGENITIKRSIVDMKMYIYKCRYEDIINCNPRVIKSKHRKKDNENISTILLKLCGAPYKNIIKNKKGHTESFTYRDFVRLSLIGETKIINSFSPIYIDNTNYTKTRCESAFKTIMTGFDDSIFKDTKTNDISKVGVSAKLDLVDSMSIEIRKEIEKLESELQSNKCYTKSIEKDIEILKKGILEIKIVIKGLEGKKEHTWCKLQQNKQDKMLLEELKNRFVLLRKNYESDIERLDFIDESEYYINQLVDIKCPICSSVWNEDAIETNNETKKLNITISAEKEKNKAQLQDLISTINDIDSKINIKEQEINNINNEFDTLHDKINSEIKPSISQELSVLEELFALRDNVKRKEYKQERLRQLEEMRETLVESLNNVNTENPTIGEVSDTTYSGFTDIIKNILIEWKLFQEVEVEFDVKSMDIIINGRKKSSFGKGLSSLLNSAFVLGLMKYTIKMGLSHPRVIVLDSPLTTYKGKDINNEDKQQDDNIDEEVKQAFYNYLSKQNDEIQIIILDNVEPPKEIQDNITYYHFTKNHSMDRYGFIPS